MLKRRVVEQGQLSVILLVLNRSQTKSDHVQLCSTDTKGRSDLHCFVLLEFLVTPHKDSRRPELLLLMLIKFSDFLKVGLVSAHI